MPFSPTRSTITAGDRWQNEIWNTLMSDLASYLGTISITTDGDAPISLTRSRQSLDGFRNDIYRFANWFSHGDDTNLMVHDVGGYGAKGDGATDDAAAIQLAIDDLAGTVGGIVLVPPGTYIIEDEIDISGSDGTTRNGVILLGFGDSTILKLKNVSGLGSTEAVVTMGPTGAPERQIIANLKIDGNKANQVGAPDGVNISGATDSFVFNVTIVDSNGNGINLGDGVGSNNSVIGCRVSDPTKSCIYGSVVEPYFINNALIAKNVLTGSTLDGIEGQGWEGCSIVGNRIHDVTRNGILLSSNGQTASIKAMQIIGNLIKGTSSNGILLRHVV